MTFNLFKSYVFLLFLSINAWAVEGDKPLEPSINFTIHSSFDSDTFSARINLQPWLSYQKLLALETEYDLMSNQQKIWWLLRKGQAENLLYFFDKLKQSIQQAQQLTNPETSLKAKSLLNVYEGMSNRRDGYYSHSTKVLRTALNQAKAGHLNRIYVIAKQELAFTRSLTELYETSLNDMQEAYVEAFALNDQFLIAIINETYGAIYGYMQDYEKSIEYYEKALYSYERLGYKAHIAEAIYGLASTYRYWQKYKLAAENFELYQQKVSFTPNTDITFYGAYGLGMTLAEEGQCIRALVIIKQALTLNGLIDYNAELYKRKASCHIRLNEFSKAEVALNKAIEIFSVLPEIANTTWALELIKIKSDLAKAQQKHELALTLLTQYHQQYTALMKSNSTARLINVRTALENERSSIEQVLGTQRSRVRSLEIASEQKQAIYNIYIIIIITVLTLIILAIIITQYRNNKKMYALSIKDPLSNLFNRRYIFDYLDERLSNISLEKSSLSVMLIDIDDFKAVNDQYGHPVGDEVIKEIASIGGDVLRHEDIMGRIGGEEFLCILPRTNSHQSEVIANRFIEAISAYRFLNNPKLKITISIGIASLSKSSPDSQSLYLHADQALYQAKHAGKNTLVVYSDHNG
jgi:diguanylate cyclase (GGDEF)-like protein